MLKLQKEVIANEKNSKKETQNTANKPKDRL